MKKEITNDVLLERIDNLIVVNSDDHKKIIEQTTRTNGRVTGLESSRDKMMGAFVVINVIVIPVLLYLLYLHIKG